MRNTKLERQRYILELIRRTRDRAYDQQASHRGNLSYPYEYTLVIEQSRQLPKYLPPHTQNNARSSIINMPGVPNPRRLLGYLTTFE